MPAAATPPHGLARMDRDNMRFVAAILRAHLYTRTMPPGWTRTRFFDAALYLGVIGNMPGDAR